MHPLLERPVIRSKLATEYILSLSGLLLRVLLKYYSPVTTLCTIATRAVPASYLSLKDIAWQQMKEEIKQLRPRAHKRETVATTNEKLND